MVASTAKPKTSHPPLHPWVDDPGLEYGGYVSRSFIVGAVGVALKRSAQGYRMNRHVVERDLTKRFEELFRSLAEDSQSFHRTFERAFASNYDYHSIEAIRCRAILEHWDFLPAVSIVSPDELRGGYGAYAPRAHTMYLSEGVALANVELAVEVMIELMGMHILNLTRQPEERSRSAESESTSSIILGSREVAVNFYAGALCSALA